MVFCHNPPRRLANAGFRRASRSTRSMIDGPCRARRSSSGPAARFPSARSEGVRARTPRMTSQASSGEVLHNSSRSSCAQKASSYSRPPGEACCMANQPAMSRSLDEASRGITYIRPQDGSVSIARQNLRVLAAYRGAMRTPDFSHSPFVLAAFNHKHGRDRGRDRLRAHAAYLGRLGGKHCNTFKKGTSDRQGYGPPPGHGSGRACRSSSCSRRGAPAVPGRSGCRDRPRGDALRRNGAGRGGWRA